MVKSFESLFLKLRQAEELNCYAVIEITSEISLKLNPFIDFSLTEILNT
jgi:hypothetical protein